MDFPFTYPKYCSFYFLIFNNFCGPYLETPFGMFLAPTMGSNQKGFSEQDNEGNYF